MASTIFGIVPGKEPLPVAIGIHANRSRRRGSLVVELTDEPQQPERGPSQSDVKKRLHDQQRDWMKQIVNATGLAPSVIAARSGVSDTTLSRLIYDDNYTGVLSSLTVERIKGRFQVPGPEEYGSARRLGLAGFAEAMRFNAKDEEPALAAAVSALIAGRNAVDPWRLRTEALVDAGYLAGDVVLVDLNAAANAQDVVCAQVYDWTRGSAETVWRIYDPPFLVGAARDRTAFKPLLVDNERVSLKGVVVGMVRGNRLSAMR